MWRQKPPPLISSQGLAHRRCPNNIHSLICSFLSFSCVAWAGGLSAGASQSSRWAAEAVMSPGHLFPVGRSTEEAWRAAPCWAGSALGWALALGGEQGLWQLFGITRLQVGGQVAGLVQSQKSGSVTCCQLLGGSTGLWGGSQGALCIAGNLHLQDCLLYFPQR